jgi:glycosyltransferase involved in cell wall biosynthesis
LKGESLAVPLVSAILTTYNRPAHLARAIESVLAQTLRDFELIVVDDGSGPETGALCRRFAAQDGRIRYHRRPNGGCAAARNAGLLLARGAYAAFLDDDDGWMPAKLERQAAFMESHPETGLCYSYLQIMKDTPAGRAATKRLPETLPATFEEALGQFLPPSTVFVRRACLLRTGLFDPNYPIAEDYDYWLRFAQHFKIAAIPEALAYTVMDGREHSGSDLVNSRTHAIRVLKGLPLRPRYRMRRPLIRRQIARFHYENARAWVDRGRPREALRAFAAAVAHDPAVNAAKPYLAMGWCALELARGRGRA